MLFTLWGSVGAAAPGGDTPGAVGLRYGVSGAVTRLVVDFDRPIPFRTRLVENGYRLLIDLPEIDWRLPEDLRPRGLISGQRHRAVEGDASQLTVDLTGPGTVAGSRLLGPSGGSRLWRLVVDLTGGSGAARSSHPTAVPIPVPKPMAATPEPILVRAAAPVPLVMAALPAARPAAVLPLPARPILVIDPGHGGIDPGATGIHGVPEKDVVLAMARTLQRRLTRDGRYAVVLTRDDDRFVRLRERIAKAREAGAALLVSLHADSAVGAMARGVSVYTLSTTASDEEAGRLASKENKSDILSGADLSHHDPLVTSILIDLAQRDTNNRSIAFADLLSGELADDGSLVQRTRRYAGFAVLKSPDLPSVLLELGYLSDRTDAGNLGRERYRAQLAEAVARAVDRWFADGGVIAVDG